MVRGPGHQRRLGGAVTSQSLTGVCARLTLRAWSAHPLCSGVDSAFPPVRPTSGSETEMGWEPFVQLEPASPLFEDGPAQ